MLDWFAERRKAIAVFLIAVVAYLNRKYGADIDTDLMLLFMGIFGVGAVYQVKNEPMKDGD
jgi:ABC-type Mn2+/Zn2+ transport system permease subunit